MEKNNNNIEKTNIIENSNIMENNNNNNNKEMSELFYNMYKNCLKFKDEKEKENVNYTKKINCNEYYDKFNFFSEKDINSKNI